MSSTSPNPGSSPGSTQPVVPPATPPTAVPPAGTTANPVQVEDYKDQYWQILLNIGEWLRFSETKAGLILTLYGVLFTIFYTNAVAVFASLKSCVIFTGVVLFALASLVSIVAAFMAVRPRMKTPGNSVIYFRHIATKFNDLAHYQREAHGKLDDQLAYAEHLTAQIYAISGVANKKFICAGVAIWSFAISLGILVLTVAIYALTLIHK